MILQLCSVLVHVIPMTQKDNLNKIIKKVLTHEIPTAVFAAAIEQADLPDESTKKIVAYVEKVMPDYNTTVCGNMKKSGVVFKDYKP